MSSEKEDKAIYFRLRNGRYYPCSREEWEQEWLDWWSRNNGYQDI